MCAQSCLTLFDPMDCSPQAPLSMGFSRQDDWSGSPFPSLGDLPNPGDRTDVSCVSCIGMSVVSPEPPGSHLLHPFSDELVAEAVEHRSSSHRHRFNMESDWFSPVTSYGGAPRSVSPGAVQHRWAVRQEGVFCGPGSRVARLLQQWGVCLPTLAGDAQPPVTARHRPRQLWRYVEGQLDVCGPEWGCGHPFDPPALPPHHLESVNSKLKMGIEGLPWWSGG